MFALLLLAGFAIPLVLIVAIDQRNLRRKRTVERGLGVVSTRASRRLHFRQPVRSDRDFFVEMAQDPVAAEANGWRVDEADMVAQRFGDKQLFETLRENEIVAIERDTGVRVGTATFSTSPLDRAHARSIGIHVHPDHRHQGYGREIMAAAILLMQYSPGALHIGTRTTNVGMRRIMSQLGYEPRPTTHPHTVPNGEVYESLWYDCGPETHPPAGLYSVEP